MWKAHIHAGKNAAQVSVYQHAECIRDPGKRPGVVRDTDMSRLLLEETIPDTDFTRIGIRVGKGKAFLLVTSRSRPFALQNMQTDIVFCAVKVLET